MKVFKFLLSYTSLFVVFLLIFLLVYLRSALFPENINKPIDAGIVMLEEKFNIDIPEYKPAKESQGHTPATVVSAQDESQHNEAAEILNAEPNDTDALAEAPSEVDSEEQNTTQSSTPIEEEVIVIVEDIALHDEENNASANDIEQESIVENGDNKVKPVAAEEKPLELIQKVQTEMSPEPVEALKSNSTDAAQLLLKARSAYWSGDMNTAESLYLQLTADDKSNPDMYGELGNIYYAQGKWKQAGDSYYEAALRLIEHKQYSQVNYLLRVIQGLNPESAKKLQEKISG